MPVTLFNLTDFLRLSAVLNYQLTARKVDWRGMLTVILGQHAISKAEIDVLLEVMKYLEKVYGRRTRRLGPRAVLHPLRTAALFVRALNKVTLLELMTCLLHDNFEDIKPEDFKDTNWMKHDQAFQIFLQKIPSEDQWYLMERLNWLTKNPAESYYSYIGRFLEKARFTPEAVQTKLVDRLDNTLDLRIALEDPLDRIDFFEHIFEMMFTTTYKGVGIEIAADSFMKMNDAQRLYQLFKNIVLLSLVHRQKSAANDPISKEILYNISRASIKEAQRIALHIFGQHDLALNNYRELLIETMTYVQRGGISRITLPGEASRLDGLFMSIFNEPNKNLRNKKLAQLYNDKPLMIEATMAFIVIFLSFINDEDYYVHGISETGIQPENTIY